MPTQLKVIEEAIRRGIPLPPDKQQLYDEAVKRGLIAAPQQASNAEAKRDLVNPPMSWGETLADWGSSLGTGVYKGLAGLAGLPKGAGEFLGGAATYGIDRLRGYSPEEASARQAKVGEVFNQTSTAPGYGDIISATERVVGPLYQPKTIGGQYFETAGEFLTPGVAGKGSVLRKVAQVAIPALFSETGGQLTKGSEYEPIARIGGALIGGGVASIGSGNVGTKQMQKNAKSYDVVGAEKKAAYDALDNAKIVFDPRDYKSAAMNMMFKLRKKGLLPEQGGEISTQLNNIMGRVNKVNGWTEVDSLRHTLNRIYTAASNDPKLAVDANRAQIMIKEFDNLVNNGRVQSMNNSVPRNAIPGMVSKARELGRRMILAREVKDMQDKSQWYLGGPESGLRTKAGNLGRWTGKTLTKGSGGEQAALQKVLNREGPLNVLHQAGSRFLGVPISSYIGGGIGSFLGNPLIGAVAGPFIHAGVRKGSELYTQKAVNDLLKTTLAGRSAQAAATAANTAGRGAAAARTAISAGQGRIGKNGPPGAVYRDGRGVWWVTEDGRPYVQGRSRLVPYNQPTLLGQ